MRGLAGKIAVVTGAGRGLGKAIAKRLADEGAAVLVTDIVGESVAATAEGIRTAGGRAQSIVADAGNAADIERTFREVVELWGGVDIVVNNAYNIPEGASGPTIDVTEEGWHRSLTLSMTSVFRTVKEVVPLFKLRGRGCIINMTSVHGLLHSPGWFA